MTHEVGENQDSLECKTLKEEVYQRGGDPQCEMLGKGRRGPTLIILSSLYGFCLWNIAEKDLEFFKPLVLI